MKIVFNFLSSIFNDIDLFKTPLLTRKQYIFSILKVFLLYAFLLGLVILCWYITFQSIPPKIFFAEIIEIIFIAMASYCIFMFLIYFNILFIKRYLDTSMPLWLLFVVPIMFIFSCSFGLIDEKVISESNMVYYLINGIWMLPAVLLLIFSFIMPSYYKERTIIIEMKNSLYIKKNILYPINNILTYNFIRRIDHKQFFYGIVFIFTPILFLIILKYIAIFLGDIYFDIFDLNTLDDLSDMFKKNAVVDVFPLILEFIYIGSASFIFFSFFILFSNTYTFYKSYKSILFVIGLIILFIMPYSVFQFSFYLFSDIKEVGKISASNILPSYRFVFIGVALFFISIILLNIYYLILSRQKKINYKMQNTTNISFKEYLSKIIIVVIVYIVVREVLNYTNFDVKTYITMLVTSLIDIILNFHIPSDYLFYKSIFMFLSFIQTIAAYISPFLDVFLFFYILYYTAKRINHAVINKVILIPPAIMYILKDYSNETYIHVSFVLYIILLIFMAKYIPNYISERKYIFNNEKYIKIADFFNISNQIENILFFKLKREINVREFILSLIFVFTLYIIIFKIKEGALPDIDFVIFYMIYPVFVFVCNGVYTISIKKKGLDNG